jgi:hypothetical protein
LTADAARFVGAFGLARDGELALPSRPRARIAAPREVAPAIVVMELLVGRTVRACEVATWRG